MLKHSDFTYTEDLSAFIPPGYIIIIR